MIWFVTVMKLQHGISCSIKFIGKYTLGPFETTNRGLGFGGHSKGTESSNFFHD